MECASSQYMGYMVEVVFLDGGGIRSAERVKLAKAHHPHQWETLTIMKSVAMKP